MQSMSDDDAAYSALLTQLLSDSAPSRNARVHSWIEHQYDFVLSEQPPPPRAASRPPSPSPSSSLGAHRTFSIDRPDSPLLPRFSSDRPSSPCPSYDALFFAPSHSKSDDFEEQERVRALRFIVQEMAHWRSHAHPSPRGALDKPLPAPPPSPASSATQSTSSRPARSRSSSTRISRLPSFTSTLSSDHSHPQEIPPPLPVSVIVHGEFQNDLVLSRDRPFVDGYMHKRDDSLTHSPEQDAQHLCAVPDDLDSALQPSPTFSTFSSAQSRDTPFTTPYASSPASPASAVFVPPSCSPENVALPSSPTEDGAFFKEPVVLESTSSPQGSPVVRPALLSSPSLRSLPVSPSKAGVNLMATASLFSLPAIPDADGAPQRLRAPKSLEYSQSRWSLATTASVAPSTAEPKSSARLNPRTPPQKKDKGLKTPKKRTRFISLISRFSPGRADPMATTSTVETGDDAEYDSTNDSDLEDKDKGKPRKSLSKKSSLASLRASFSISRASFSSQRPPMSSTIEEIPPLPTSPTLVSPTTEVFVPLEVVPAPLKSSLPRISSRANLINTPLPPIPQSASTITSFHSSSQHSASEASAESRPSRSTPANASRVSLLPAPSKRTSLASAAGIEPMVSTIPVPAGQTATRSKSIFRLTAKPKSIKAPTTPGTRSAMAPSKFPADSKSVPAAVPSRIPHAPATFNPPAKLANVIATQTRQVPSASRLPSPPSRMPAKAPRSLTSLEKPPAESLSPSSRLPMPATTKGTRVATVKGFWKRQ